MPLEILSAIYELRVWIERLRGGGQCHATQISFGHVEVRFVDTSFIRVHIGDRLKHENTKTSNNMRYQLFFNQLYFLFFHETTAN